MPGPRVPDQEIVTTGLEPRPRAARLIGVDVARGTALLGMMAVHAFDTFDDQGAPTPATTIAAGRSAATFVLLAGVGLALMSGGRQVVRGYERTAAAAGLAVRALLIGALGLALGMLADQNGVAGILPVYALLFLLAVPLLGSPPLVLAGVAAGLLVVGPVLLVAVNQAPLPFADPDGDPTFGTLVHDPLGLLVQLLLTGAYPAVAYLAYICAGLAIGRLDLTSRRVVCWLFGGGIALAAVARLTSAFLLHPLGGLSVLVSESRSGDTPAEIALTLPWEADSPTSWWYLALPAPHSQTSVDLAHTLGSAIAVLGAALLLSRLPVMARVLSPLAAAGSMPLTLYSAHLVLLATGVLEDQPALLYVLMVLGAIAFAVLWRRWLGPGPLERIVALPAGQVRRRVAHRLARRPAATPTTNRRTGAVPRSSFARAAQFLVPVALAAALVPVVWAGTRFVPEPDETGASAAGAEPPAVAGPPRDGPPAPAAGPGTAADVGLYCRLSDEVGVLEDQHADDPEALLREAAVPLTDMSRVAPAEISAAVHTTVTDIRAEAGEPGVQAPEEAALDQAEDAIDAFEEENCA